jgi:hypothetical protein
VTGPEHYKAAESLTGVAAGVMDYEHGVYSSMGTEERIQRRAAFLAEAQVHATLALAAATADAARLPEHHTAWAAVHP